MCVQAVFYGRGAGAFPCITPTYVLAQTCLCQKAAKTSLGSNIFGQKLGHWKKNILRKTGFLLLHLLLRVPKNIKLASNVHGRSVRHRRRKYIFEWAKVKMLQLCTDHAQKKIIQCDFGFRFEFCLAHMKNPCLEHEHRVFLCADTQVISC